MVVETHSLCEVSGENFCCKLAMYKKNTRFDWSEYPPVLILQTNTEQKKKEQKEQKHKAAAVI